MIVPLRLTLFSLLPPADALCREGNTPDHHLTITYSQLLKQVCKCANALKQLGKSSAFIFLCPSSSDNYRSVVSGVIMLVHPKHIQLCIAFSNQYK